MEAGVDRHGHQAGVPDGEQRLKVLGPVPHPDGNPVSRHQTELIAQARGRAGRPGGELTPGGMDMLAIRQRRVTGSQTRVTLHPNSRVHHTTPLHVQLPSGELDQQLDDPSSLVVIKWVLAADGPGESGR